MYLTSSPKPLAQERIKDAPPYQTVFQRYEKKYLIETCQYMELLTPIREHLTSDEYANYTITNLYFDTERFDLARLSEQKPLYREKLRFRGYGNGDMNGPVFIELKKKFRNVVYKRRARSRQRLFFWETPAPRMTTARGRY
jgi:hypothetical protein